MLVDDEEAILDVFKLMLNRCGCEVTAYRDSLQALADFKQNPGLFDLIITDKDMPRLDGARFARIVLGMRPETRMILCSGSAMCNDDMAKGLGFRSFLPKPVSRDRLIEAVRHALGSPIARERACKSMVQATG